MSAHPVTLKPIDEVAKYKRALIPAYIPDGYALNPKFYIPTILLFWWA